MRAIGINLERVLQMTSDAPSDLAYAYPRPQSHTGATDLGRAPLDGCHTVRPRWRTMGQCCPFANQIQWAALFVLHLLSMWRTSPAGSGAHRARASASVKRRAARVAPAGWRLQTGGQLGAIQWARDIRADKCDTLAHSGRFRRANGQ